MPARLVLRLALLVAPALAPAAQTTWYVDDDGLGGTGTANEPFCTIQEGIDAASTGDLVLVLPGTYTDEVSPSGAGPLPSVTAVDFRGKDLTVRSAEGPEVTVIDGPWGGFGTGVVFGNGEGPGAVLEGFTIQRCNGAIYCHGSAPTIAYNVIVENYSFGDGGGLYLWDAGARILYNTFERNEATPGGGFGGAIFSYNSNLEIVGNVFRFNDAWGDPIGYGGAMCLFFGTAEIAHNLIANNTAFDYGGNLGGGICLFNVAANLDGNTIVENVALPGDYIGGYGGGIYMEGGLVQITNTVLWGNRVLWGSQPTPGAQLFVRSGLVGITSSSVQGGPSGCAVTDGTLVWGDGNLTGDPLFADPALGDYHLRPDSPLLDAGFPAEPSGGVDFDGDPRLLDGRGDGHARVDIGYDEHNRITLSATGSATLGGTLTLTTAAPAPDHGYALVTSEAPGDLAFGPLGSLLLDLATIRVVALGVAPASDPLALPATPSLAGTELYAQSLAIAYTGSPGSFSNRLRFVLAPAPAAP